MFFSPFGSQNQAEVWQRFQNMMKLLLRTDDIKWVKVLNVLSSLCLWQCFIFNSCACIVCYLPVHYVWFFRCPSSSIPINGTHWFMIHRSDGSACIWPENLRIGCVQPQACVCTTSNFLPNTMVIIVEMVIMDKIVIMVEVVIMVKMKNNWLMIMN